MIVSFLSQIYTRSASFFTGNRKGSILLLVLLSAGFYGNTLGHDFVWDDRILILHNPYVKDVRLLGEGLTSDFWRSYEDPRRFRHYYRPVVTVSYFLDYALWGENPTGYHLSNLLFHSSNVILLFLSSLLLFEQRQAAALLAAALFAVHPAHTESVSWISGRTDLLASFFVLLSFFSYLRLSVEPSKRLWLYLVHIGYLLAVLSKEVAILFPAALALHLLWLERNHDSKRRFLRRVIAIQGGLGIVFLLFRSFLLQMPLFIESRRPVSMLILNMPRILARYLQKLAAPVKLYAHDPMVWVTPGRWPLVLIATAALAGTTLLILRLGREDRRILYGSAWCLLFLLPVLNAGTFTDVLVAERFVYLPSVGFCWVIGSIYLLTQQGFPRKWLAAVAGLLVLVAGFRTWHRNPVWDNPMTLFQEMVRSSPHYPLPHVLLGEAYQNAGDPEAAILSYERALEMDPDNCRLLNAMALAQLERGVIQKSVAALEDGFRFTMSALGRCPNEDVLHHTLAEYYLRQRNIPLAVEQFKEAIALNPFNTGYYYNIGAVLSASGKMEEARPYLEEFVRRAPRGDERRQAMEWLGRR